MNAEPQPPAEFGNLGPYRLIRPIGSGGFASVYEAVDERLDAVVAIKVLGDNHALSPEMRERFITEAQLLRRAQSDSLIQVYDVGETDGQPYYAMKYVEGESLAEMLEGGPLTNERAARYAREIALALEAAHTARPTRIELVAKILLQILDA